MPVKRVKKSRKNQKAIHSLFVSNKMRLTKLIYAKTSNIEDTKSILQKAYIEVINRYPDFDGQSTLETWLYNIITTTLQAYYKEKMLVIDDERDSDFATNHPNELSSVDTSEHLTPRSTIDNSTVAVDFILASINISVKELEQATEQTLLRIPCKLPLETKIVAGGQHIGMGEIVQVNGNIGVLITSIGT